MTGFLGGLGSLFGGGTTPEEQQRAAIFQAGLATLANAQQPGATFGGSLFSGFQAGAGSLQQAQQNAFQAKQEQRREEREERIAKAEVDRAKLEEQKAARESRERSATAGQRFSTGLDKYKTDPLGYFNVVKGDPDLQAAAQQVGFDLSGVTTPEQVTQLAQQLGAYGSIGAKPPAQSNTPADIASYEFYSQLTPEQQQQFLEVKRNSQPFQLTDFQGGKVVFNRVTGKYEVASTAQQEAAGESAVAQSKATATTVGKGVGEAQLDLQRVADNAAQAKKAILDLKAAPGFDKIFGFQGMLPNFPGGEAANAQVRLNQVAGKTFLEAFNSLKGAGQITEIEGKKGTDAIARLDKAQSADEARLALDELISVIDAGEARARKKAAGANQSAPDYSSMSDDEIKRQLGL